MCTVLNQRYMSLLHTGKPQADARQSRFVKCHAPFSRLQTAGSAAAHVATTACWHLTCRVHRRAEAINLPDADTLVDAQLDLPLFESTFDGGVSVRSILVSVSLLIL